MGHFEISDFLNGAIVASCVAIGLRFLSFWRDTRERLFLLFALAFWTFAANWAALEVFQPPSESRFYFYFLRLIAFALILAAILDKNRAAKRRG